MCASSSASWWVGVGVGLGLCRLRRRPRSTQILGTLRASVSHNLKKEQVLKDSAAKVAEGRSKVEPRASLCAVPTLRSLFPGQRDGRTAIPSASALYGRGQLSRWARLTLCTERSSVGATRKTCWRCSRLPWRPFSLPSSPCRRWPAAVAQTRLRPRWGAALPRVPHLPARARAPRPRRPPRRPSRAGSSATLCRPCSSTLPDSPRCGPLCARRCRSSITLTIDRS
jgi:hypothetical protein